MRVLNQFSGLKVFFCAQNTSEAALEKFAAFANNQIGRGNP
jgi:hypothetical protein